MVLIRLLNACHYFPGFVYDGARLREDVDTIAVEVRPRQGAKPRCSGCQRSAAGYDRLAKRRFQFIPLWGYAVVLRYTMRRVDCRACGVKVEQGTLGAGQTHPHRGVHAVSGPLDTQAGVDRDRTSV